MTIQSAQPEYVVPEGGAILAIGAALAGVFVMVERYWLADSKKNARRRIAGLASKGYQPAHGALAPALPGVSSFAIVHWSKKGRSYLDQAECRRLQAEVDRRWADLAAGSGLPPLGHVILTRIRLRTVPLHRPWSAKFTLTLETSSSADRDFTARVVPVNADGLFDVTDLGVV